MSNAQALVSASAGPAGLGCVRAPCSRAGAPAGRLQALPRTQVAVHCPFQPQPLNQAAAPAGHGVVGAPHAQLRISKDAEHFVNVNLTRRRAFRHHPVLGHSSISHACPHRRSHCTQKPDRDMQGAPGTAGGQQDAAVPAAEQLVAALRANGELERLRSLALEKLEKDVGWEGRKQPRLPCATGPSPPLLPPLSASAQRLPNGCSSAM